MKTIKLTLCSLAAVLLAAHTLNAEGYRTTLGTAPDDFPVIVVNDCYGGDYYAEGRARYAKSV